MSDDLESVVPSPTLLALTDERLTVDFSWGCAPLALPPMGAVNLPRPKLMVMRDNVSWPQPSTEDREILRQLEEQRQGSDYKPDLPPHEVLAVSPSALTGALQEVLGGIAGQTYAAWVRRVEIALSIIEPLPRAARFKVQLNRKQVSRFYSLVQEVRLALVSPGTARPRKEGRYRRAVMRLLLEAVELVEEILGFHESLQQEVKKLRTHAQKMAKASDRFGEPVRPIALGIKAIRESLQISGQSILTQEDRVRLTSPPQEEEPQEEGNSEQEEEE